MLQFDPRGHDLTLTTNLEPNPAEIQRLGFRSRKVISSMRRKTAQSRKKVSVEDSSVRFKGPTPGDLFHGALSFFARLIAGGVAEGRPPQVD